MAESNIPLEDPMRDSATDGGLDKTLPQPTLEFEMAIKMALGQSNAEEVGGTLIQSTPDHEGEDVELKRAIEMLLGQPNAEATEDSSVNYAPIDMEEQAELELLSGWESLRNQAKAQELNNSAVQLIQYFKQSGDCVEIDMAVQLMEEAIKLTPDGHADKASWLNTIGVAFLQRFEHLRELGDIGHAIQVMQQAVDLTPDGHADKAAQLTNLGSALLHRFECFGELGDIEHAIQVMQQAVDLTPDGHPDKAAQLTNLGGALQCRFEHLGELGDIENATSTYQRATTNTSSPPSIRYEAACKWATLCSHHQGSSSALHAYKVVLEIIHLTCHEAVIETVKCEMSRHEIVHLACHGIQDSKNPLDSALALYNGRLKLQDLMCLSLENVELAFLSASQTAAGNENLPEEAVHLAAGMLAVGYPSVIATMWSIGDKDAPIVADKFYESILGRSDELVSQNPRQSAAYALHAAVEHLRKEVSEMEFVKWVPFIHYRV
ncbi:hypothetical protein D9758_018028 [Tetrapyrgos nigripes]|uniref:CHAT domain-containing protein n=1 Tax=Tetrapyrgos nigripes TaxID=182062 RepID=A0A8H5CDB0_9AGAR|nr:hypothetical protein D9758_018028 [Tetrapyrgos nigripes]